jgi:hypothetical protein
MACQTIDLRFWTSSMMPWSQQCYVEISVASVQAGNRKKQENNPLVSKLAMHRGFVVSHILLVMMLFVRDTFLRACWRCLMCGYPA